MSTRCQVVIEDGRQDKLWFYRHSDGYPEGVLPTLEKFMTWVKEGKIRNNVEQASGWLILIGAQEYRTVHRWLTPDNEERLKTLDEIMAPGTKGEWKVGAYEPSIPEEHEDIEYLYTLNLEKLTIKVTPKSEDKKPYFVKGWKSKRKEEDKNAIDRKNIPHSDGQ